MKTHIQVLIYHSFGDPIFKGLMLRYLKSFQKNHQGYCFHLITFEQRAYRLSSKEQREIKDELGNIDIKWSPLHYHTGGAFIIFKKVWDSLNALAQVTKCRVNYRTKYIIGFTALSGVISYVLSKLLFMRAIVLNMEPHSEYMSDFGTWKKSDLKYKVLNYLETVTIRSSYRIACPTRNAIRDFQKLRKTKLDFVPTSIDHNDFDYLPEQRISLRKKIGALDNETVIVYMGKFGGIYFDAQSMASFANRLSKTIDNSFFVVVTTDDNGLIEESFLGAGVSRFMINEAIPFDELSGFLSAADIGLLVLPEYPSQRYRCPIKTANYLACGLPILVNSIVGDEAEIVTKNEVGWVVDFQKPVVKIKSFPSRDNCMDVVKKERGLDIAVRYIYESVYAGN